MRVMPIGANRATRRIDLASHARGRRMLRADFRTQARAYLALAACSNISRTRMISGTVYSKKFAQPGGVSPAASKAPFARA